MALKRNVAGLVFWVVLVPMAPMANALEARGQSPVLMQVASSRSPPNAGFFLDEVTGSSTADRISDAVREGQRRTSIAEVEAVHVAHSGSAKSETGVKSSETKSLTSAEEFRLFPTMKLDRLKDASSKVMSLVAEGARAAAESVAPSAVQKPPQSQTKKVQKAAPSALSLLGQMRQAKMSVLQRTDASHAAKAGQERQREESKDLQQQQPERLHSKSVAYDEAVAEEEAKRRREEEAREEHAKMEDLMDEVRKSSV